MKICWDNLEDIYLNKNKNFSKRGKILYILKCKACNEDFLGYNKNNKFCTHSCSNSGIYCPSYGKKKSEETKKKISENRKGKCCGKDNPMKRDDLRRKFSDNFHNHPWSKKLNKGKNNPNWKGGYKKKNIACFDTYASQIDWIEEVRRNEEDLNILEVKCVYCGKWYIPSWSDINNRIQVLKGNYCGDHRLYCSSGCKEACPIYRKKEWPSTYLRGTSREVQPQLRQLVFKRDDYKCVKCENSKELHCHHILPVSTDPLLSADIDNCITLCVECHKEVHKIDGCKYGQLKICLE